MVGLDQDIHPIWVHRAPSPKSWSLLKVPDVWNARTSSWSFKGDSAAGASSSGVVDMAAGYTKQPELWSLEAPSLVSAIFCLVLGFVAGKWWERGSFRRSDLGYRHLGC